MTANRSGFLTSEFLLTLVGVVALTVLVLADKLEGEWAAGAIAFACFGYQASRAVVKKAQVEGDVQVTDFKADLALLAADEAAKAAPATTTRKR